MNAFTYKGSNYININGKQYYIITGYKNYNNNDFIFLQVSGNIPLKKEDLPDKNWQLIRTSNSKDKDKKIVYTIFNKQYFKFQSKAKTMKLLFVGQNYEGAIYMLLKFLIKRYSMSPITSLDKLVKYHIKNYTSYSINRRHNIGDLDRKAILLNVDNYLEYTGLEYWLRPVIPTNK